MIGRRGFITGLAALVAAPAVIRVAPLMRISSLHTPLYVPASWLAEWLDTRAQGMAMLGSRAAMLGLGDCDLRELRSHAWSRPMADNWVNVNDYDPSFVKLWGGAGLDSQEYGFS